MRTILIQTGKRILQGICLGTGMIIAVEVHTHFTFDELDLSYDSSPYKDSTEVLRASGLKLQNEYIKAGNSCMVAMGSIANNGTSIWSWVGIQINLFDAKGRLLDQQTHTISQPINPGELVHWKEDQLLATMDCVASNIVSHTIQIVGAHQVDK